MPAAAAGNKNLGKFVNAEGGFVNAEPALRSYNYATLRPSQVRFYDYAPTIASTLRLRLLMSTFRSMTSTLRLRFDDCYASMTTLRFDDEYASTSMLRRVCFDDYAMLR